MAVLFIVAAVGVAAWYFLAQDGSGGGNSGGVGGGTLCKDAKMQPMQIASFAQGAGFSGSDLVMATAIALAESAGDPCAVGDNGTSTGLWQIHFTVHPEFNGWNLMDPQTNARAAYSIYSASGNTFTAWTTYNDGISAALLSEASEGVTEAQGVSFS